MNPIQYTGWHVIIVVAVLAAVGEFASGMIRKASWALAAVIVVLHAFMVWSKK